MIRTPKYLAALAAVVLSVACSSDPTEERPAADPALAPEEGALPIRWEIKGASSLTDASRVMIGEHDQNKPPRPTNPAHPDFYITLDEVCDKTKAPKYAVGLFGDYSYEENGKRVNVKDFYRGARLTYSPTSTDWDTDVALRYWHPGAVYVFTTYYPQRLYTYTVSTSTATTLAMVYPSRKLQYDLMFGSECVDTNEPDWLGTNAVQVHLKHALAALRFQFRLNFEDADLLTSVYLLSGNDGDEKTDYFSQGMAVYGRELTADDTTQEAIQERLDHVSWSADYAPPADEILYKWVPPLKYWYSDKDLTGDGQITLGGKDLNGDGEIEIGAYVTDYKGNKTYETDELSADEMVAKWGWNNDKKTLNIKPTADNPVESVPANAIDKPTDKDANGVQAHMPRKGLIDGAKYNPVLMYSYLESTGSTGTPESPEGGIAGNAIDYTSKLANAYYGMDQIYFDWSNTKEWIDYPEGDRAVEGGLYCRNGGWLLIPPQGSFGKLTLCFTTKRGGRTLYKVKLPVPTGTEIDENGDLIVGTDGKPATGVGGTPAWVAGYRYTYLVTISESNYTINVTIKPWNERKHSTEIIF